MQHNVDFIEGKPVFHQTIKCFKAGPGVAAENSTSLRLRQEPYSVTRCIGTSKWHNVTSGSIPYFYTLQRQNDKSNALLIGRDFIALRKETAPGN